MVPTELVSVFQSLDPSIIKSIDVHEGEEVQAGQLLATLDPDLCRSRRQATKAAGRKP